MGKKHYFTVEELIASDTAVKYNIDNTPGEEEYNNLEVLICALDSLREHYGKAIIVTSGYRCPALNKKVGGVATSAHVFGYAADLVPKNGDFDAFVKAVESWVYNEKPRFDQVIIERNSKGSQWVHFGLYNKEGDQRQETFSMDA